MAVMRNKDGNELYVDCYCGCNDGIRLKVDKDEFDFYYFLSYTNGNWYRDQTSIWMTFCNKLKKIWAIIRNKDHYYAEITMTKEDFDELKEYINSID